MNINTVMQALRDTIADDTATKAWAQATYARDHKVYIGLNQVTPPPDTDYPLAWLYPVEKTSGDKEVIITHTFGISCRVNDASTATGGKANVVEYNGVQHVEAFRKLVETAALSALRGQALRVNTLTSKYDLVDPFPKTAATMTVTAIEDTELEVEDVHTGNNPDEPIVVSEEE